MIIVKRQITKREFMNTKEDNEVVAREARPPTCGAEILRRMKEAYGVSSFADLADAMGAARSTVGNWSHRDSVPLDALIQCNSETGVSFDKLILGSCSATELAIDSERPPLRASIEIASRRGHQPERAPDRLYASSGGHVVEYFPVPRYTARASAGPGLPAPDDAVAGVVAFEAGFMREQLGRVGSGFAVIAVRGTSMEPTLFDGMSIVVDTTRREVEDGGIYVLRRDGDLFVKRLQVLMSGALQIISDNPAMRAELVPAGTELQLDVIGKVVWPRSR